MKIEGGKIILTYDINNYRNNRNNKKKIEQNKNWQILINIYINKSNNKYIKNLIKNNKSKNYYGYGDRHNLEDNINNHSYYESLYYKKAWVMKKYLEFFNFF